jgi:hypothetical protein
MKFDDLPCFGDFGVFATTDEFTADNYDLYSVTPILLVLTRHPTHCSECSSKDPSDSLFPPMAHKRSATVSISNLRGINGNSGASAEKRMLRG